MWSSILCLLEPDYIWHNLTCLKGECPYCGIDMFMTCPFEKDKHLAFHMQWECYELVVHGKTRAEKNMNNIFSARAQYNKGVPSLNIAL